MNKTWRNSKRVLFNTETSSIGDLFSDYQRKYDEYFRTTLSSKSEQYYL